jgi:hypothetical protein
LEKGAGDAVVETVRQITEALIWGEQNDTNFFDFFCEKSILADFIRVLGLLQAPKEVKVQLLQTLSMLVQNIRRQTSVYYLLSGNYVNKLIAIPLDFNDEEILAYYITLLKSLAMRLDRETIKFFFIQHPEYSFPLYIEAAKFFSHRDQMVRAAVRTITLQVYRTDDKAMQRFVLRHARETYFNQLALYLRDLWLHFNAVAQEASGEEDLAQLQHRNDLQQDLLIYLSDVFDLEVAELNEVLAERLLNGIMLPVLLPSIARLQLAGRGPPTSTGVVELGGEKAGSSVLLIPSVALFLLRQVFDTFHCRELIEPMAEALLQHKVPSSMAAMVMSGCKAAGYPVQGSDVANPLREHFLGCLKSNDDTLFLLASSVIQSCMSKDVLTADFLERVRILPGLDEDKAHVHPLDNVTTAVSSAAGKSTGSSQAGKEKGERKGFSWPKLSSKNKSPISFPSGPVAQPLPDPSSQGNDVDSLEIWLLLLQGLHRHISWQIDDFQVFARLLLDILLDAGICHHKRCQELIQETLQGAMRTAAQQVRRLLQGCTGKYDDGGVCWKNDDSLLDLVLEEWELHKAPLGSISIMCSNPRTLLPPAARMQGGFTTMRRPRSNDAEPQGQKAVRVFLLLRRLLHLFCVLSSKVSQERGRGHYTSQPWANVALNAAVPMQVEEESSSGFCDDMNIEVGPMERIVCSIATPQGKQTRYFLIHDYWLLLVQPDLTMMGWAVIKTLWPIRSVQSLIDRSDPRTLRIGMHAIRGTVGIGEALVSRSSDPAAGEKASMYLTLTLCFEDVKRCIAADKHLAVRRREVREKVLLKALAFVDGHCSETLPLSIVTANTSEFDTNIQGVTL